MQHVRLADYDRCAKCGGRSYVADSVPCKGYRRRTHRCRTCGHKWRSYQSRLNPRKVKVAPPPAPIDR